MSPRRTSIVTLFVGPVAASTTQLVSYFLAYPTRPGTTNAPLFLVAAIAASIIGAGAFFACDVLRERDESTASIVSSRC